MLASFPLLLALSLPATVSATHDLKALVTEVESAAKEATSQSEAVAAVQAAAKAALETHAADLAKPENGLYYGQLLIRSGEHEKGYDTLVAYADANETADEASMARLEAFFLGRNLDKPLPELQKLAAGVDESKIDAMARRPFAGAKQSLADEVARGEMAGKPAPHFEAIKVLNAPAFDLKALRGKVVLLDFWATWCPPCRAVIPELIELQKEHPTDVQIVGVTRYYGRGMDFTDPEAKKPHGGKSVGGKPPLEEAEEVRINEAFIKAFEVNYPIVFTEPKVGGDLYKVRGIPTVFVIDKEGNLIGDVVGGGPEAHKKLVEMIDKGLGKKTSN